MFTSTVNGASLSSSTLLVLATDIVAAVVLGMRLTLIAFLGFLLSRPAWGLRMRVLARDMAGVVTAFWAEVEATSVISTTDADLEPTVSDVSASAVAEMHDCFRPGHTLHTHVSTQWL